MDSWITSYTHKGREYVTDNYTGTTMPAGLWKAIQPSFYMPPVQIDPEEQKRKEITAAKRAAKVDANAKIRKELMQNACEMAKKIQESGVRISIDDLEAWRIANGYLWKVVSPKGTVYTETLKPLTIKEPENFTVFHAMEMVCYGIVR